MPRRIGISMGMGSAGKPANPYIPEGYAEAVAAAGGVPLALPPVGSKAQIRGQLDTVDGLLLVGSPDYHPKLWGEKLDPATNLINPRRMAYDLELARQADRRRIPVLGICGGHQLISITRGGSIIQDLGTSHLYPKLICHSGARVRHRVDVEAGTLCAKALGRTRLRTNSFHHQAVRSPGRNLRIVAHCCDGVVEAIEDPRPGRFVMGVQWHPERMFSRDRVQLGPFRALVKAAGARRRGSR